MSSVARVVRAACLAASVFVWAWMELALRGAADPPPPSVTQSAAPIPSPAVPDTTPDALVALAAGRDPFALAGHTSADSLPTTAAVAVNEPALRVLGTVVDSAGGSFALCQLGSTHATILRVGQRIGDYELRRVDKGFVVFARPDGERIELHVPRAGA